MEAFNEARSYSVFDEATSTASFVATDKHTNHCAIIDSVLDFDYAAGKTGLNSANSIIKFVQDSNLTVDWILETHDHALATSQYAGW